MYNTKLMLCLVFFIGWLISANPSLNAQDSLDISVKPDSLVYGKTPDEYKPYKNFVKPYRQFFIDKLQFHGYGRHIPEPNNIDSVKIGFIGPIIDKDSDPTGDLKNINLRVGERVTRWDGYKASHLAPIGKKMLQGAQLAIEQANKKGGYQGKIPYKLIIRNDNGNWRSAGRETIMLAYRDSVWAVLGTVDGANSHIAIRAALKAEVPVMNTADTDPTFVETSIPWAFRCITDDRQMCYLLADFAFKKLKLKRIAALRASNRYGRMSIDEFRDAATRMGLPFITELQYQEGDTSFTQQLERIQSLNADAVITYGNVRESAMILKQMRDMGMHQWYLGSDRMVGDEFLKIIGKNHSKIAAAYPYDPKSDDTKYLKFLKDFKERFGENAETYAAHAFDGLNMVISAIEKAGLNRALIRDELAAMKDYDGITGKKEFDAIYSNRTPAMLAILKNGKFEFYSQEDIFSKETDISK
ncbi:MAG: ABC transporter substrate-binding protein [Calditrichaeota bacterium]|nr:ABC transporter substrate-binding protein [Calditrichota bacterium]